jgi:hypothetical protein
MFLKFPARIATNSGNTSASFEAFTTVIFEDEVF